MLLWTIQTEEAYLKLIKNGVLHADRKYIWKKFLPAYNWLIDEMKKRIGDPPEDVKYPIWVWYQYDGERKRRDLRYGGYAQRGMPMVQLTIDIDEKNIVFSDFDNWHFVLNNMYLALNEEDDNRFEKVYEREGFTLQDIHNLTLVNPCLEKCRKETVDSWQRIFDIGRCEAEWDTPLERKTVQGTFWELKVDQVIKAEHFIAK